MYGVPRPVDDVTDVPHSGHVKVRRARFRSWSQCHMPETKKCGFACLNSPVNPHVGHFILELCLAAMLSTQRFQFGFIVFAGLAMPHVVRSNNRMWRPQHNVRDHRAGTEIYASINTRKSGFACIVLLSDDSPTVAFTTTRQQTPSQIRSRLESSRSQSTKLLRDSRSPKIERALMLA